MPETNTWLANDPISIEEDEVNMATGRAHYQAYMLRLWQDQDESGAVWRGSLESPHTGERRSFADLEELFDFLRQRVDQISFSAGGNLLEANTLF